MPLRSVVDQAALILEWLVFAKFVQSGHQPTVVWLPKFRVDAMSVLMIAKTCAAAW